jgi:hypothetical protein
MGIDMTDEISANSSNVENKFERREIVEFHDRILRLFNRAYSGPFHDFSLPVAWWANPYVRQIRREIVAFLKERIGDSYFGFKDPRAVRLMPVWHHILNGLKLTPKIVLCQRNPSEVARSLKALEGVDLEIGEYRWLIYMIDFLRYTSSFDVCVIDYEEWFNDPLANFEKLREFLDLRWQQREVDLTLTLSGIINPALNHSHSAHRRTNQSLVYRLYELTSRTGLDGPAREQISDFVSRFVNFQQLQRPFEQAFEGVAEVATKLLEIQQEAASLRAAIDEHDQIIEAANARANAGEARVAEIEDEAAHLRAAIDERDQIIEAANARASDGEARVVGIELEAAHLRAAIEERDQIIEVANARASAAEARFAEIELEAARLRAAIAERNQIAEAADARTSAGEARLAEIELEAGHLRAAIEERDQIIAAANARTSAGEARLAEIELEAGHLRAAIEERDQITEAANARANAGEARFTEIEEKAAHLQAAIGERDQIIEAASARASAAEALYSTLTAARQVEKAALAAFRIDTTAPANPAGPRGWRLRCQQIVLGQPEFLNWACRPRRGEMALDRVADLLRLYWKPRFISLADRARDAGQWELAVRLYRKALDRNPYNPPIWVQYGHALKESGELRDPDRLAEAELAYRRALSLDPGVADTYLQRGHVLKLQGKTEGAQAAYLHAFALDPSIPFAPVELSGLGWSEAELRQLRQQTARGSAGDGHEDLDGQSITCQVEEIAPTNPGLASPSAVPAEDDSFLELFVDRPVIVDNKVGQN